MRDATAAWLAERAETRVRAGLTRRLQVRRPDDLGDLGDLVDLAGNDYLGLARDPRVTKAAADAAVHWGAGAAASRLVTGSLGIHDELERALASWMRRPAALVLSTGYHANLAVVSALADGDTLIVSDAHVHASLIDGCRLARATTTVVPHLDAGAVDAALTARSQSRALVLTESVFSVLGDAAPLEALLASCIRHDATLVVDDAHALGVAGPEGRGLTAALIPDSPGRLVVTTTLSKALGAQGGAVLADPVVIEHLVNAARPFIFDTGLAPAAAGAALASLGVLEVEPGRAARARAVAGALAAAVHLEPPAGAVLSVPMTSPRVALAAQAEAARSGLRIGCFRPPSVPDGVSRLRLTGRADLSDAALAAAVGAVRGLGGAR
ncbi:MAG: 8-amino-7-oxononanoate synthase [Nocardioidaceae bacterium]